MIYLKNESKIESKENMDLPSKYNPGTKVHNLVIELKKYLEE